MERPASSDRPAGRVSVRARGAAVAGLVALLALGACAPAAQPGAGGLACDVFRAQALPDGIPETSGVAWSRDDPAVFWTVNDGRTGTLFAVDTLGALRARIRTRGPEMWDVEELAAGPCGDERCLYLADVGDNRERRDTVALHRVVEPALGVGSGSGSGGGPGDGPEADGPPAAERTAFPMRFPDGAQDVEAVFVTPDETVYLITKGRRRPPALYRYPPPLRPDTIVVLERVQALSEDVPTNRGRVTGAAVTPDGRHVLVRTYELLHAYALEEGRLVALPDGTLDLRTLREPQGEAVTIDAHGRLLLTSESGPLGGASGFHLLRCRIGP